MTARAYASRRMDARERHLRLLTETIEAVNSTLDLEEVLSQVATKVADALHADACFVYLYDERTGELVLRATHGTNVAEMTQRRVQELEALARISEAVSESLYLEESLEAIVKTTMDALSATGAALVLEDGKIAWPEGRADAHAIRQPLRWRGREIGELVADR